MFINWSILISILYKLHYVNCDGDKKIHKNPNSIKFYKLTRKELKFFHKMIFSWKKHVFNVRKQNSWNLNGRKEIHITYPLEINLEFTLLWDHQTPKNPCSREKIFDLDNDLCNISLQKLIVFQGKASASQTYNFNEFMRWLRNKYLEKSEQCW